MSRRTAMVGVLIAMFFLSYFYRTSPAVIAPYLSREFSLGAERLGLLSSIFFTVFAAVQIPLGPALDFIGPRRVISILGAVGALGSLIFALAPSYDLCLLGRGLNGLGMSCMYMGTLTIVANWYPPRSFATVTGIVASLGNMGALSATLPLALLAGSMGWRGSFLLFAAINFVLAILVWIIVRDRPSTSTPHFVPPSRKFTPGQAFRAVLGSSYFWAIAILSFFSGGSFLAIQGLWGGPFLMDVFGLTPVGTGSILSSIAIGYIIGCPLIGMISDRIVASRKKLASIVLSIYLLTLLLFCTILQPGRSFLLLPVYFSLGFFASGSVLLLAQLKELFPGRIVGTALTCNNLFSIGGAGILQYVMGWIIERHPPVGRVYPIEAYREAFLLILAGLSVSFILYLRTPEPHPKNVSARHIVEGSD
ncbi:MAG: MFS transporter [Thermodesulfobacteriota bacterium]